MEYKTIFECCNEKMTDLGITFDFTKNRDLQDAHSLNDVYSNCVLHSQNKSNGRVFNVESKKTSDIIMKHKIMDVVTKYKYSAKKSNEFEFLDLFNELLKDKDIEKDIISSSGKEILYIGFCKTCQCIHDYVYQYNDLNDFINHHKFVNNYKKNKAILDNATQSIYNMGIALIPDFFKEQRYLDGSEYLIKADLHVKRFFSNLYGKEMNEEEVYEKMMDLYNGETDEKFKKDNPPYNLDKIIYKIGSKLRSVEESKKFADDVAEKL